MRQMLASPLKYRQKTCYSLTQLAAAGIGSFSAIAIIAYLSLHYNLELLVPSFGASAVLLYGAPNVPMAQPKNLLGGHLISAFVGITVYQLFGYSWWSLAFGVSLAIISMIITDTLHPPGGGNCFYFNIYTTGLFFYIFSFSRVDYSDGSCPSSP